MENTKAKGVEIPQKARRRLRSKHTKSLFRYLCAWVVLLILGILFITSFGAYSTYDINYTIGDFAKIFIPVFGILFTILLTVLHRILDAVDKRLATVDLFFSEISSICTAIHAFNLMDGFEKLAKNPSKYDERIYTKRSENYTDIFNKNCDSLGSLDRDLVRNITAFYTFFKSARDSTESLKFWYDPERKVKNPAFSLDDQKKHVIGIIIMLQLCFQKAFFSLRGLAENESDAEHELTIVKSLVMTCANYLGEERKMQTNCSPDLPNELLSKSYCESINLLSSDDVEEKMKIFE